MDIEVRLFAQYERSEDAYMIRAAINSEVFSFARDVMVFRLCGGEVSVIFGYNTPRQSTALPKTGRGKAALAQATTIFAPQLVNAIKGEFGMSEALAKRLIVKKQLVLSGFRKDYLMAEGGADRYFSSDGIRMVDIKHRMTLESKGGEFVTISDWDTVGAIYSIPCGVSEGTTTIASPEMSMDGKMLFRAKFWGRGRPINGGTFFFLAAEVEDMEKQYAVIGAELFAQADTAWLFTYGLSPSNSDRTTYRKPYPLVVTREVK